MIEEAKYKIVRQADGKVIKSHNLQALARYFDCGIMYIKLHLDKPVQLNGWEVKSI
jgi:hypothetical protein